MLKYINLFITIICFCFNKAYTQDTLLLKNKKTELVKVTEIGLKTISYNKYNNLEGPLYTIEKDKIQKIIYSNGTVEKSVFDKTFELKNNKIQIVATDLLIPRITCTYERLFFKGLLGVEIPLMYSFEDNFTFETPFEEFINDEFLYSAGLNINFYPIGQRNVLYFVGPGFRTGKTFYYRYNPTYKLRIKDENLFYHIYITNGFATNITKSIGVSSFFSIGLREEIGSGAAYPMSIFGTTVSYRF